MLLDDQFHAPAALLQENEPPATLNSGLCGSRIGSDAPAENRTTFSQLLALKHKTYYASPSMRNTLVHTGVYGVSLRR